MAFLKLAKKFLFIYRMAIDLPVIAGIAHLAVDDRLPKNSVLIGSDFGKETLIKLIESVKSKPQPVLTVTRAMDQKSTLATTVAETLQSTEGANPTSWDSIVPGTSHDTDVVNETDDIDTSLPSDTPHDTMPLLTPHQPIN